MSLQSRLEAFAAAVGADVKSLQEQINGIPGGGLSEIYKYKDTDQGFNGTTSQSESGLNFTPILNKPTYFRYFVKYTTNATTNGIRFGLFSTGTFSHFMARYRKQITVGGTASTDMFSEWVMATPAGSASGLQSTAEPAATPTELLLEIEGVCLITTVNQIFLNVANEVAATPGATIKAGSFMSYRQLIA